MSNADVTIHKTNITVSSSGRVLSVAGKTGVVTLGLGDIEGLNQALEGAGGGSSNPLILDAGMDTGSLEYAPDGKFTFTREAEGDTILVADQFQGTTVFAGELQAENDLIIFTNDGEQRWKFTEDGHLRPISNGSFDVGANELRVNRFYLNQIQLPDVFITTDDSGGITFNNAHLEALANINANILIVDTVRGDLVESAQAAIGQFNVGSGFGAFVDGDNLIFTHRDGSLQLIYRDTPVELNEFGFNPSDPHFLSTIINNYESGTHIHATYDDNVTIVLEATEGGIDWNHDITGAAASKLDASGMSGGQNPLYQYELSPAGISFNASPSSVSAQFVSAQYFTAGNQFKAGAGSVSVGGDQCGYYFGPTDANTSDLGLVRHDDHTLRIDHSTIGDGTLLSNILQTNIIEAGEIKINAHTFMFSAEDGQLLLTDSSGADFDMLQFGNTDGSAPALQRYGSRIQVVLADNSLAADIGAKSFSIPNGAQVAVGTIDKGAGGSGGISQVCAVGFELNWQAQHLTCYILGDSTPRTIFVDSPLTLGSTVEDTPKITLYHNTGWSQPNAIQLIDGGQEGSPVTFSLTAGGIVNCDRLNVNGSSAIIASSIFNTKAGGTQGTYIVAGPFASTVGGDNAAQFNITCNNESGIALSRFGMVSVSGAIGEFGAGGHTSGGEWQDSVFFNTKGSYPIKWLINGGLAMSIDDDKNIIVGEGVASSYLLTINGNGLKIISDSDARSVISRVDADHASWYEFDTVGSNASWLFGQPGGSTNFVVNYWDGSSDHQFLSVDTDGNITVDNDLIPGNLDTDSSLSANSDTKIPSQKAVKSYVDANSGGGTIPNLVSALESTDFVQSGAQSSYLQLGTINPSITISSGSRVRVKTTGRISESSAGQLIVRLNIDSDALTIDLGRFNGDTYGFSLESESIISNLSTGTHTFKIEYTKSAGGILFLRGATQPTLERFGVILEEILS